MEKNRNVPLRLLAFTAVGTLISLILDHFARDQTIASFGIRTLGFPQMAIPFSGSYLVGLTIGLAGISSKGALLRATSLVRKKVVAVRIFGMWPRWPHIRVISVVILSTVLTLICVYAFPGVSFILVLLGMISSSVVE